MTLLLSESVPYVLHHGCQIAILRMIRGPKMPGSEQRVSHKRILLNRYCSSSQLLEHIEH